MADQKQQEAPEPKRGEAAWKATKERVAARNAEARKAAKQVRQAAEQKDASRRRAEELRERAGLADG